jgi:hypothetical protein
MDIIMLEKRAPTLRCNNCKNMVIIPRYAKEMVFPNLMVVVVVEYLEVYLEDSRHLRLL